MESVLTCSGCAATVSVDDRSDPYPFRCPNFDAGDVEVGDSDAGDVDHVLVPAPINLTEGFPTAGIDGRSPFEVFRRQLGFYRRARRLGLSDDSYLEIVGRLDDRIAALDGRGFAVTTFYRSGAVSDALGFDPAGGVWVKDETGNVSGSHKARHLMGVMIHLLVSEKARLTDPARRPTLGIASCGNAALGAAVLARAADWPLKVYVPSDADTAIRDRLLELGTDIVVCERQSGETGDPTLRRLLGGIAAGVLAFTCQGNLNALSVEGGGTLGFEIVARLVADSITLDHLVVQVGGGALASSTIRAFDGAVEAGLLVSSPKIHALQPAGAAPLARAYTKLRMIAGDRPSRPDLELHAARAARQRSAYMWPWEHPASVASGIIDDETYDWLAVVKGMLKTGGTAIVASEGELRGAHAVARAAGFPASPTGSAGVAGVTKLVREATIGASARVAVVMTGIERG